MTPEEFQAATSVSRETLEAFRRYAALLEKWNRRINLVASGTLASVWQRHFLDSAQLWPHRPPALQRWVDLGSGAGFPGLVIGLMARDTGTTLDLTLIEADMRKSVFLRTVAQELALPVTILPQRIEEAAPQAGDVVSARALAPLPRLVPLAARHLAANGKLLLLKGRDHHSELTAARRDWHIAGQGQPSLTDPHGSVLVLDKPEPLA